MLQKHEFLPFRYVGIERIDEDTIQFLNVVWDKNWGPYVRQQSHEAVVVDSWFGTVKDYDVAGHCLNETKFATQPVATYDRVAA